MVKLVKELQLRKAPGPIFVTESERITPPILLQNWKAFCEISVAPSGIWTMNKSSPMPLK